MIRALVVVGALFGLAGVGLSALAAHRGGAAGLDTAARFLLVHGPALLAAAALVEAGLVGRRLGLAGSAAIAVGTAVFAGDLAMRVLAGAPLAPMAAPAGGMVLMTGWLLVAVAAMMARPKAP